MQKRTNVPIDVIVSGNLCLDLIPAVEHLPLSALSSPGRLFEIGPLRISTGGSVSNTGLALHRLGTNVRLMAAVGDDLIGQLILNYIDQHDSSLSEYIQILPGLASSYTIVLSPEKVDRIFLHCTGADNSFGSEIVQEDLITGTRIFHLGYPSLLPRLFAADGDELEKLLKRARATGVVTSLDMSLPDALSASGHADWPTILKRTLPYTDIFLPSLEEALFALRREDYDRWRHNVLEHITATYLHELADELISMGVAIAGFKLGEMGLFIKTATAGRLKQLSTLNLDTKHWAQTSVYQPAFKVDVAGTTGAGDAAYAGFLLSLLMGVTPVESARVACAVGACCVEAPDATTGIKNWADTLSRIDSGWRFSELQLSS